MFKENMFAKCKTIEELHKEYNMRKRGCNFFEWLRVIEYDYDKRYDELTQNESK